MTVSDKGFTVARTEDKSVVWNTDLQTGQLVVESQYLEITNQFPKERPDVFGLGERDAGLHEMTMSPMVASASSPIDSKPGRAVPVPRRAESAPGPGPI